MGRRRNELRNAAGLILKLRMLLAEQDLKISFYMQALVPPPLLPSAPSLRLLWRRHWVETDSSMTESAKFFRNRSQFWPRDRKNDVINVFFRFFEKSFGSSYLLISWFYDYANWFKWQIALVEVITSSKDIVMLCRFSPKLFLKSAFN